MRAGAALLRSVAWAVVVGTLLRCVVIGLDPFEITGPDAGEYVGVGRYWREHGTIPGERGTPAVAPPLYPLLVALSTYLGDRAGILALKILNLVAGAVATVLAFRLARRNPGLRCPALAAWVVALHPALIWYANALSTDVLFVALLLGGLEAACRLGDAPRGRTAAGLGLLWGLAALLRPASVLGSALLGAAALVTARGRAVGRRIGGVAIAAAVAAVVIAPWSVYVSLRFHEPILLTDTSGYNFWDGHHPVNGRVRASDDLSVRDRLSSEKHEELMAIVERSRVEGLGRHERSNAFFSAAKVHLEKGDPTLAEASWDNFLSILRSWPDPVVHGWPLALLFAACLGPMGALGALGLAVCLRRRRGVLEVGALGLVLGLTFLAIAFIGLVRYRFVHIDPILAVFVPVGWQSMSATVHRIFFGRSVRDGGSLPAVPA